MNRTAWIWARLNREQLKLLAEAEETLGADFLLAYRQDDQALDGDIEPYRRNLQVTDLNESQLECLGGLEERLQAVVVAYQQANP